MDMTGLHEECWVPLLDDVAVILRHTPEIRRDLQPGLGLPLGSLCSVISVLGTLVQVVVVDVLERHDP